MMNKLINNKFFLLIIALLINFNVIAKNQALFNFNEPNLINLKKQFISLKDPKSNNVVSIIQLGDSHTAADLFTGELRQLLQQQWGDAGIGWITPLSVKGQRHALVSFENKDWQIFSNATAFTVKPSMGGYIAKPLNRQGYITISQNKLQQSEDVIIKLIVNSLSEKSIIKLADNTNREQKITIKKKFKSNGWQSITTKVKLPVKIFVDNEEIIIGSMWIQKLNTKGVIVSPIGTNGAKLENISYWHQDWFKELKLTKSQLIMVGYGTNEAFFDNIDENKFYNNLKNLINSIRANLPNSAILLMTPPDTGIQNNSVNQPPSYKAIRHLIYKVAKQEQTLLWDWQQAMGGEGIIQNWLMLDLAKPDLVHLTKKGYEKSAILFYKALLKLLEQN